MDEDKKTVMFQYILLSFDFLFNVIVNKKNESTLLK